MNDYLWEARGEPDDEVARLEKVLGSLRHQHRSIEIPYAPSRHGFFRPQLAAAAVLVIAVLASAAWWLASRPNNSTEVARSPSAHAPKGIEGVTPGGSTGVENPVESAGVSAAPPQNITRLMTKVRAASPETIQRRAKTTTRPGTRIAAHASNAPKQSKDHDTAEATRTREEGTRLKTQLLLALDITGDKLRLVERHLEQSFPRTPATGGNADDN